MPHAAATTVRIMMGVLARARELEAADEADMGTVVDALRHVQGAVKMVYVIEEHISVESASEDRRAWRSEVVCEGVV
jgi:hypothetical protein